MHDYNPDWDYEVDRKPPKQVVQAVKQCVKEVDGLLKAAGLQKSRVYYIRDEDDAVARYISGTATHPVFVVNARIIYELMKDEIETYGPVELIRAVRSTLVHEVGHAVLESIGIDTMEHDEDFVEESARDYCDGYTDAQGFLQALEEWAHSME